ncbi:MAG: sulfatase [Bacteroidota bacterium]
MRKLLLLIAWSVVSISLSIAQKKQPNILIIMTDQQFADAMSCVMGDEYLSTPNMDYLAANGVRFARAYSPNPLCTPMRTSMMTGEFPHQTRIQTNNDKKNFVAEDHTYMGKVFEEAGYETGYFGKWHVAIDEEFNDIHGFNVYNEEHGRLDSDPVTEFLKKKHNKPFLAFASFLSPHEVCQWARKEELPGEPLGELPSLEKLPPLKVNFGIPQNETDIEAYMRKSYQANRRFTVGDYTDADWRRLRWGYYRLIERADMFVGEVVSALRESGQMENTIVVFLSDHGDCAGSHHWNQKTVFYDESTRVPLIISWKDNVPTATSNVLVNTGLDLFPTLCDMVGIQIPSGLEGRSLKSIALGNQATLDREFLVVENHMIQGDPIEGISLQPHGRMVRSDNFKYCVYSEGEARESLVDMQFDPQEMVNQARNPIYLSVLEEHRALLRKHADATDDRIAMEMLKDL